MKSFICIVLSIIAVRLVAADSRPNVLILFADQWRAQAFGYAGDPNVKTPNIDRLARESVNLSHAIASVPVCAPTRASLLTGQRALTHGVFMNDVPLRNEAVTFAEVLKTNGYDTAYVGKWHLNGDGHRSGFIPRYRRQGFDYWKVLECTHDYNNSFYYGDTPEKLKWEGYDAEAQTKDTQRYLHDHAKSKKPFVFFLAWGPPHSPYQTAPKKFRDMYDPAKLVLRGNVPHESEDKTRKILAGYYAHCTALDHYVGDLLKTVETEGLSSNTIVIFSADHGDMLESHGMTAKQKPYEESIRVPLLVRWPKHLHPQTNRTVFTSEDFAPTLLGLCGAPIPKSSEGRDLSRNLRYGTIPKENFGLIASIAPFADFSYQRGGREFRGLRTERYTYVRDLKGPWLLFDNELDPLQQTNQLNHLPVQADLDRQLQRTLKARQDDFQPARVYVEKWGYHTNATGTVPYTD